jgi:hypothetical protein
MPRMVWLIVQTIILVCGPLCEETDPDFESFSYHLEIHRGHFSKLRRGIQNRVLRQTEFKPAATHVLTESRVDIYLRGTRVHNHPQVFRYSKPLTNAIAITRNSKPARHSEIACSTARNICFLARFLLSLIESSQTVPLLPQRPANL